MCFIPSVYAAQIISQKTTILVVAPGALPAWRLNMNVGDWKEISGSKMSLCPPSVEFTIPNNGPNTILEAWNGLAIDPRDSTIYSVANGGHNDWAGNEVFAIKLSDNAPKWIEKRKSSPENTIGANQPYNNDGPNNTPGTPTSRHSYNGVEFSMQRNRVILMGGYMYSLGGGSNFTNTMDGYNIANNTYDPAATYPKLPVDTAELPGVPIAMDSDGNIYSFGKTVQMWNSSTNTWKKITGDFYAYSAAVAFDSTRKRFLLVGGDLPKPSGYIFDISGVPPKNTLTKAKFSGLGSAPLEGSENAMIYVPSANAFFYTGEGGNKVYKVDAVEDSNGALNVSEYVTRGGGSAAAPVNGIWKRWLYSPQLGGAFYVPSYNSNIWFLRLN